MGIALEILKELCPDPHSCSDRLDHGAAFFLSDNRARYVASGSVNLFIGAFNRETGAAAGAYLPVAELEAGEMLFPAPARILQDGLERRMLAVPLPDCELRQSRVAWMDLARQNEFARRAYDQFIGALLTPFVRAMPPTGTRVITASDLDRQRDFDFPEGTDFRPGRGLIWVFIRKGSCILNGEEDQLLLGAGAVFPLSARSWLHAAEPLSITCMSTSDWLAGEGFESRQESAFGDYIRAILTAAAYMKHRRIERRRQLVGYERLAMKGIFARLRAIMSADRQPVDAGAPRVSAARAEAVIRRIAQACGSEMELPGDHAEDAQPDLSGMMRLLERANLFYRKVKLSGEWWLEDGAPMIVFDRSDSRPFAVFRQRGRCRLFDPDDGSERVLTAEAAGLDVIALAVYARLPSRPAKMRDVLSLSFLGLFKDLKVAGAIGLIGGLVALAPARVTSTLFNSIIPMADYFHLLQVGVILFSAAFTGTLFELARSMLMLRVKTRADYQLQAAVWGRMLNLPASFFQDYSSGDLAQRVMGVRSIRSYLTDNVSQAAMAMIFSLPNLGLMLYYSRSLAGIGLLALLLYSAILVALGYANYQNQREEFRVEGELSGFTLQAITGITKIRMSVSENRAFARWAGMFAERIRWKRRSIGNMNILAVIGAVFPPVMAGVFFLIIGSNWRDSKLNAGNYLAFNTAFTSLIIAFTGFASIVPAILASIALYKRARPILEATPENGGARKPAGRADGNVEMRNVTYRYRPGLPPVLRNVTIHAERGEFVAIAGPSGAGKSTVARLLLGFDNPESGGIYYGGMDMAAVNPRDLRKQVGVVMQGGGLMQTSIYENIAGASGLSLDGAWTAAALAGCDADIKAMPMGMHTLVSNTAVSGGQRQRLLIARALARNPRIVIFDEATSALDNETQKHVSDSLERINATRIVIAHRLSTIIHADRIYVMDEGRIVQTGTFEELINQPGLFQRLARRQML